MNFNDLHKISSKRLLINSHGLLNVVKVNMQRHAGSNSLRQFSNLNTSGTPQITEPIFWIYINNTRGYI